METASPPPNNESFLLNFDVVTNFLLALPGEHRRQLSAALKQYQNQQELKNWWQQYSKTDKFLTDLVLPNLLF